MKNSIVFKNTVGIVLAGLVGSQAYASSKLPRGSAEILNAVAKQRGQVIDLGCVQKEGTRSYRVNFGARLNKKTRECSGGSDHFAIVIEFDENDQVLNLEVADA